MTNKKTEEKFERLSDEQKNIIKDMVISLGSLDNEGLTGNPNVAFDLIKDSTRLVEIESWFKAYFELENVTN